MDQRTMQRRIQGGDTPFLNVQRKLIYFFKIVIYHMKYPKPFRTSLRPARFVSGQALTWNPAMIHNTLRDKLKTEQHEPH